MSSSEVLPRSTVSANEPRHLLHIFPSFGIGGVPLRMVRIINHLGTRCRHTVIALDGRITAGERIERAIDRDLVPDAAPSSALSPFRYARQIASIRPDFLLTYNWGSIEWAAANRLWARARHIHLESGFGVEEASGQLRRRVLARRWALAGCEAVIVPSHTLERIALDIWKLRRTRLRHIPNGIDVGSFDVDPAPKSESGISVGTVAPLRPEKNVGRLIRAFAALDPALVCRLVIVGDGAERPALERLAAELGLAGRVAFLGERPVTGELLAGFDVFALSSDTEQMPNALIEAMAAGLPVAAVDVGDVREMVAEENRTLIVPRDDGAAFARALAALARDTMLRRRLGALNRARAIAEFPQERMFAAYESLFLAEP